MPREPLSRDTSLEAEALQIDGWRRMAPAEKAATITGLTQAVYEMARAGIRQRYPNAPPREQFLRLAIVSLGADLARKAYPEIARTNLR